MISPQLIIILSWVVFFIVWFIGSFNVKQDTDRAARWRTGWMRGMLLLVIVVWISQAHKLTRITSFPVSHYPLALFGSILAALGIGFAVWARLHLGRNWSPVPTTKEHHELVTSGPYARVRHPIYTGMLMAILGSGLAVLPWLIMFVIALVIFSLRVKKEEALMTREFPDQYPAYKKRTWALIPFVW